MHHKRLLVLILIVGLLSLPVYAVSGNLQLNSPYAVAGTEFLLRVSLLDPYWYNTSAADVTLRLSYNPEELEFLGVSGGLGAPQAEVEGGEILIRDSGAPQEYKLRLRFRALKVCDSPVQFLEAQVTDAFGQNVECQYYSGIVHCLESGDDATLYELSTVPGELSPAFSPDIHSYTLTVSPDTEGIQVVARPNGYYATGFVEGHWGLHDGHNIVTVDTTSACGISGLYTIDVFRGVEERIIETEPTEEVVIIPEAEIPMASGAEVIPEVTPEPTPEPAPAATVQADEETLRTLYKAEAELATARETVDALTATVKTSIVICMAELIVIVILTLTVLKLQWERRNEEEEEDYDEDE